MAYSPKSNGLFEVFEKYNYHKTPTLVGVHLNLNLRWSQGAEFIEFIHAELGLELSKYLAISISSNSTCIDTVFSGHIEQIETREYISYFSNHRPLLCITSHSADSNVINYVNFVPIVREPLSN